MPTLSPESQQALQGLAQEGIMFNPANQTIDLSKDEKRRVTALFLAINAYEKLIIKDAEMYREISKDAGRLGSPVIQPATMNAMVDAAIQFDDFISGRIEKTLQEAADADTADVNSDPEGV